ncbi:MAG: hypothetical protein NZM25_00660 [Leptospiraceae bacterium]|nr:hypothetical protein [Leptospiraceae bacterium]MDW8306236.1 5-formyltetrahydrofolate cyclo-ligase [Leptospiraceae bacterium]
MALYSEKKSWRQEFFRRFSSKSPEELLYQHTILEKRLWFYCGRLLKKSHVRLLIYKSLPSEIPIEKLVAKSSCQIFFPKILGRGLYAQHGRLLLPLHAVDFLIVPCLLFNSEGYRLGRGGGFYDRALRFLPKEKLLLLARAWQKEDQIPVEEHDVKVPLYLTDEEISFFVQL